MHDFKIGKDSAATVGNSTTAERNAGLLSPSDAAALQKLLIRPAGATGAEWKLAITDDDWVKAMNAAAGALTTAETMLEVSQSSGAAGKGKVPELEHLVGVAKQLVAEVAKTDRTKSPEATKQLIAEVEQMAQVSADMNVANRARR
jgi:hypothetical protein